MMALSIEDILWDKKNNNFNLCSVLATSCDFPAHLENMCGRQHGGRKTLQNAL